MNPDEVLDRLYQLVGTEAVLLPIPYGTKKPTWDDWDKTTFADTRKPAYQQRLAVAVLKGGNLGVRLGVDFTHWSAGPVPKASPLPPAKKPMKPKSKAVSGHSPVRCRPDAA